MAYGDIMDRLNDTRPVRNTTYNGFIPDGQHDIVVTSIEPYTNQEQNFCVRVTFLVENSNTAQQGTLFDAIFNLDKPAPFPGGERDKDRFAAFLNTLQGIPTTPTSHQELARACLKPRAEGGQLEMQPCRGARIKASGYTKAPKEGKKPFCQVSYTHVPQVQEGIVAMRQMLDVKLPFTPRPQQAPQVQQPAPAQTVAYPNAPHAATGPAPGGWSFPK